MIVRALITGASGTVGTALQQYLTKKRVEIIPWNRREVPLDDYAAIEQFVQSVRPDTIFHLAIPSQPEGIKNEAWMVHYHWSGELAWLARQHAINFVFTSSVMVYSDDQPGPYHPETKPAADSGYGKDKLRAEQRVRYQNPGAVVVRLGWQIGDQPGGNHMVSHLHREMVSKGVIRASRRWLPACSFLDDTVATLTNLVQMPGDVYLLDANEHWSYYDIVTALNRQQGNPWQIEADDEFVHDQRMIDDRVKVSSLRQSLTTLA